MEQFIGSAKVLENYVEDEIVHYKLDNGLSNTATQTQFLALVSEAKYDDGQISLRKWKPTIENILKLLLQENTQFQDVGWILDRVSETTAQRANEATAKLMGVTSRDKVTLKRIDEILKAPAVSDHNSVK